MKSPYTEEEKIIADALVLAWNAFCKIEQTHPGDMEYFGNNIRKCQHILGMRTLRRDYPEIYPTYNKDKNEETKDDMKYKDEELIVYKNERESSIELLNYLDKFNVNYKIVDSTVDPWNFRRDLIQKGFNPDKLPIVLYNGNFVDLKDLPMFIKIKNLIREGK